MPFLVKVALAAQKILLPLGGWGIFVAAALDSSFLSLAGGVDLWLVSVCALQPSADSRRWKASLPAALLISVRGRATSIVSQRNPFHDGR